MRIALLFWPALALAIACGTPPPPAPVTTPTTPPASTVASSRHNVVVLGRMSGASVSTPIPGGKKIDFRFVENGRGPAIDAIAKLAPDHTLTSFDAVGHNAIGIPIDEHFVLEGKKARWSSSAEKGEKEITGPAFYIPLSPMPELMAPLVHALEKAGGKLALLPEGEAHLEKTGEMVVRAAGKEKKIFGYAVTGIELSPIRVWLDEKGEFFGMIDAWFSCLAEGWEPVIPTVIETQKALDRKHAEEVARAHARKPPAAGFAFTHARVLDVAGKKWLDDHTVVVENTKIVAVGPSKTTRPKQGAEIVDAKGMSVLPGLWDMHMHFGDVDGELCIASGVTTGRDLGNDHEKLDEMKARFDEGVAVGPHIIRAGLMEGRGEKAAGAAVTAETEEEAKAGVDLFHKRGYEQIKIYNSMKPELVPLIAQYAHSKGMRVSGHVPVHMRAEEAVRAGYDELNHLNMVFLNFFIDKDTDTRTTLRFSIPAEKAAGLDLTSKPVKDFVALLLEKKTVLDPTLNVFENLFVDRVGAIGPGVKPIETRLPVQLKRNFLTGGLAVPEGKDALYRQSFDAVLKMTKLLHDAGVPMVAGTDALAGLMYHRELELYVMAGLKPADVLYMATLGAAKVMKKEATTGTIAKGMEADLVLVNGDPLANISDIRKTVTVLRSGTVYESADLYQAVGVKPL
jgi:cytosine/adenosine deaminase-related metal-dependent hydrolase